MKYRVRFTPGAEEDLLRLFDHLAEQDLPGPVRAQAAIAKSMAFLELLPFSCRKAQGGPPNPLLREMIIPLGNAGHVALFEIEDPGTVTLLAVRHQREEDYH
jgi:plasmid stabilization system protein ParE